ncbi:fumarylacetoacetate hydrolase family protein [Streptomyces sp. NRRL S-340]|uniref:fumarylacetoacetate hydrolase family protein n=1 Tax=Streptomyces sp. NRRL S-340 TaxID=1463901 RepID=UPI00056D59B0|nr:fumarylacetoacetate hydrolase family protein [Streptomyces sp. NRRL S-340]
MALLVPEPGKLRPQQTQGPTAGRRGRTQQLTFSAPALIAKLSGVLPLVPGDVIFTRTSAGAGPGRTPQRRLAPGDALVSSMSGIGELRQQFVA